MNNKLSTSLELASSGDKEAVKAFFITFLDENLIAPRHKQDQALSNSPEYPNELFDMLGVQDGERVLVPVFTEVSFIQQWCGQEFRYRERKAEELIKLLPENWWLVLNPGQEIEKEISPWEIKLLNQGKESIAEIVEEVALDNRTPLQIQSVSETEFTELKDKISEHCKDKDYITQTSLLIEEEEDKKELLLGVVLNSEDRDLHIKSREELTELCAPLLIGDLKLKILTGSSIENDLSLGMFKYTQPFYQKAQSFFSRLKSLFSKKA